MSRSPWLICLIAVMATAGRPAAGQSYIGAERCAACHAEIAAVHRLTAHAQALRRPHEHPLEEQMAAAPPVTRPPGVEFLFSKANGRLRVRAESDEEVMEMDLDWAFGAGSQGVTFATRGNELWYLEHAMSYFPADGVYDRTPGHEHEASTLTEAVGILYPVDDPEQGIQRCFECHSSGPVSVTATGIEVAEQGVQCESCHGPGGGHATAAASGELVAARKEIVNPSKLDARGLSEMCGRCHRPPGSAEAGFDTEDPWNVRHAPPYLLRSKCFTRGDGALSCLSCHPPHEPLRQEAAASYTDRCIGCHAAPKHTTEVEASSAECVDCHMPKVRPHPRLAFTNHWIGVYAPGRTLKPQADWIP